MNYLLLIFSFTSFHCFLIFNHFFFCVQFNIKIIKKVKKIIYSHSSQSSGHPRKNVKNLFKLIEFLSITNLNSMFSKLKKSDFFDNFITKKFQIQNGITLI